MKKKIALAITACIAATILTVVFFIPNNEQYLFSKYEPVEEWSFTDTVSFSFSVQQENLDEQYNTFLSFRHTKGYMYNNLWVKYIEEFPNQDNMQMVEMILADKEGKWRGKCTNSYCLISLPINENYTFQDTGIHTIRVVQYMRDLTLKNISDVGITIKKVD